MSVFSVPEPNSVPPLLEDLTTLDSVFVKLQIEYLESEGGYVENLDFTVFFVTYDFMMLSLKQIFSVITGCETNNRYKITSSQGDFLFTALEDNNCFTRFICGPLRPFNIEIKDIEDRTLIHLYRPLRFGNCICPCIGLQVSCNL